MCATSLREFVGRRSDNRFPFRINRPRFIWSRRLQMNPALELVGSRPAACPLFLVRPRRTRARDAADRAVADVMQRVVRNLVRADVCPDPLLVPIGEGVDLPDVVTARPLDLRRVRTARRLVAPDPG